MNREAYPAFEADESSSFDNFIAAEVPRANPTDTLSTTRQYYRFEAPVYGHGALERTLRDEDTGRLFLDM